jgi:hypothetical protein
MTLSLNSTTASTGHRENVGWWRFFLLRAGGDERRMRGGNFFARSEVSSMITSSKHQKGMKRGSWGYSFGAFQSYEIRRSVGKFAKVSRDRTFSIQIYKKKIL